MIPAGFQETFRERGLAGGFFALLPALVGCGRRACYARTQSARALPPPLTQSSVPPIGIDGMASAQTLWPVGAQSQKDGIRRGLSAWFAGKLYQRQTRSEVVDGRVCPKARLPRYAGYARPGRRP